MMPNPISCSCAKCSAMCANSTCLPTPAEARALIRSAYAGRLATYQFYVDERSGVKEFVGPAPVGYEGRRGLPNTKLGACTFHTGGLCELHRIGLKPLEGRLALHDRPWLPIRLQVCATWKGRQFESVEKALKAKLESLVLPRTGT